MTKNLFYTILLSVVNILFPILSFPYASHILGPIGIGKVQFAVSFAQYFALFAALGIPIYGIKETAKHKDDPKALAILFTELTSIFIIASLILFFIYLGVIFTIPFFTADRNLYLYGGIIILFSFFYTDWFFSGLEEFRGITVRSILVKSICLLLLYMYVRTEADFGKYLLIIIFSILGNQMLSFFMAFRKTRFHFASLDFGRHFKPLLYIFSATMAASIYSVLDTVLLGFLSNAHSVGLYTAAVKLIKISIPIITAMGVILIPSISKNFALNNMDEIKQLLDKSFKFIVFLAIPICFGLAILAPEFIRVFSGEKFIDATASMRLLSALPVLIGFGHFFCFQILMPSGRNREIFLSMLAGVAVCLVLNFALVPFLQEKGAAIANILTEVSVTAGYFYFVSKHYSLTYNWKFLMQSLLSILLFFPVIMYIRYIHVTPIITLALSIIICAMVYIGAQIWLFKNIFLLGFVTTMKSKFGFNKSAGHE